MRSCLQICDKHVRTYRFYLQGCLLQALSSVITQKIIGVIYTIFMQGNAVKFISKKGKSLWNWLLDDALSL